MKPRADGPRGYLLMEVLLAAAILAAAFGVAADHMAAGRRGVTLASHKQTAVSLATAKAEDAIASLPGTVLPDVSALQPVDPRRLPGFSWRWSTTEASAGASQASVPAIRFVGREVVVHVDYPTEVGSPDDRATAPVSDGRATATIRRLWFQSPLPR